MKGHKVWRNIENSLYIILVTPFWSDALVEWLEELDYCAKVSGRS